MSEAITRAGRAPRLVTLKWRILGTLIGQAIDRSPGARGTGQSFDPIA
jgi:hypothetical protein